MRAGVSINKGRLADEIEAELARDVTLSVGMATASMKYQLRDATATGWKGNRLPKAWRSSVYPKTGDSMDAAGMVVVSGNAADIIETGLKPTVITAKGGFWLAIPTKEAGRFGLKAGRQGFGTTTNSKGARERITPGGFERRTGLKLRMVYEKGGRRAFLVVDEAMLQRGIAAPYRSQGRGSKLYGPAGRTIVVFTLVPRITTKKRFDLDAIAEAGAAKAAGLIVTTRRA